MKKPTIGAILMLAVCLAAFGSSLPSIGKSDVEALARQYYANLAAYDFAAMQASTTPEFEAIEHDGRQAMRMNRADFEERLKAAQKAGATLKFDLADFNVRVTTDAAYATYVETAAQGGRKFYAGMSFVRVGDRWLADRLFTLPIPESQPASAPPALS